MATGAHGPRAWHRIVICARCGCPIAVWESQEVHLVEHGLPVDRFHCADAVGCRRPSAGEEA